MIRIITLVLLLLLLAIACTETPTDSDTDDPPVETDAFTGIIFVRHNSISTKSAICRIDPDGTGFDSLTSGNNLKSTPDLSPDGTQIVYSGGNLADSDLYTISISDSTPTRLTNLTGLVSRPDFSADGSRILFQVALIDSFPDTASIYLINSDGTGIELIASTPSGYHSPVWSPTSADSIYFMGAGGLVHMMNLSDRGKIAFPLGLISPSNLTFSPVDSTFLLAADVDLSPDSVHWHIHRGDFSGARPVDISDPDMYDLSPSWSPDGSQFVFKTHGFYLHDYDDALFIADADGSNRTEIPGTNGLDDDPVWSPVT